MNKQKLVRLLLVACAGALLSVSASAKEKKVKESPVKVKISGAEDELRDNLEAYLPSLRNIDCKSSAKRLQRYADAAYDKMLEGAEAMGYFSSSFEIKPVPGKDCWVVNIAATPGQPVLVRKLDIKLDGPGKDQPEFKDIMAKPPYQLGDKLVSQPYEDFKSSLKQTANILGYFDADMITHRIEVRPSTREAQIALEFNTGQRYRFGQVTIEQDILAPKYIKRYIRLQEGEPFRSEKLIDQQSLLAGSGYYKNVRVKAAYDTATDNVIPVHIEAPRRKRYSYEGSIGYATNDGPYIDIGMNTHWVNNKGHQLGLQGRISQKDPRIGLNYKVPMKDPEHEYMNYSVSWERSDNDDIKGTAFKLGLEYNRRTDNDWQQKASISYLDEDTKVDGEDTISTQLTLFGLGASKVKRDDTVFPTKGWRLDLDLHGASEAVLSDNNVLQAELNGKFLHTFRNEDKIILRTDVGMTLIGDLDDLPRSLRYFAGGQNSVRGYDFEKLGVRNREDEVIGGEKLLVLSAEYEKPLKGKLSAAAFVDAGNAFNSWSDMDLQVGYGLGMRYKSPLGPVRVDIAVPEHDTSDVSFYVSMGPDL